MFLEFFIWGGWFVNLGTFLVGNFKASGGDVANSYLTQSIGAIIAPFIIGLIADRFFSAQKILGVLHLAGGLLLWRASTSEDFASFYPNIVIYMILYMPTLALVNSVALKQMNDPKKQFGSIRVLGTIGWICAAALISWLSWDKEGSEAALVNTFKMSAVASILLGLFSFTLPATPPSKKGKQVSVGELLGFDAIGMLKNKSYLIFFLSSLAISIPLAFYYSFANIYLHAQKVKESTFIQSSGQMSEIIFMICIPFFFVRLGVKKMLAIGMLAWAIRYVFFAYGDTGTNYWMIIGGLLLHGVCYDFFFVTGQIYTDNLAGERFKSSAQGFITLATYGVGMLIGSIIAGKVYDANLLADGSYNWQGIWYVPAAIAAVVLVIFMIFFKDEKHIETQPGVNAEDAEIVL